MVDRRHRELSDEDIAKISDTYHIWRREMKDRKYEDVSGFCKSASVQEIEKQGWILTPGRYVGAEEVEEDEEAFEEKMNILSARLSEQIKLGQKLDSEIKENLMRIGFEV